MIEKACPVVFKIREKGVEVLAFTHPSAGKQFVKGSIHTPRPSIVLKQFSMDIGDRVEALSDGHHEISSLRHTREKAAHNLLAQKHRDGLER